MARVAALLPCAGQGKRMGGGVGKPYIDIWGRPLLAYTLDRLQEHPLIGEIVLITRAEEIPFCRENVVDRYGFTKVKGIVAGGKERQDSVLSGLRALDPETEWVVIHDGVRPLLSAEILTRALETAFQRGNAVVGVPAKDTIKVINPDFTVKETPDRQYLWQIQTPQIFRKSVLLEAYQVAAGEGWQVTDDASLVEKLKYPVHLVKGDYTNIKVTTPEDLVWVKEYMRMDK